MLTGLFSLSRGNIKKQFARKSVPREEPNLCHSAIFLENNSFVSVEEINCLEGEGEQISPKLLKNHFKNHKLVGNYD